MSLPIILGNT